MQTARRVLTWLVGIVLVLTLALAGGGYLWLRGSLPQTSGTIRIAGLSGPVEVVRDAAGIPHIRGSTEEDALLGLGYVHAQDRLWQMEFQRRIGNGRLSEVLGEPTRETDMFLRTLGPHRAAAQAWTSATAEERRVLEAYVRGVNAFISTHRGRQLPIEFSILGFEPEPWRPEDVIVWIKMMSWNLGGNWADELLRARLVAKVGPEKAAELLPAASADDPVILPADSPSAWGPPRPTTAAPVTPVGERTTAGLLAVDAAIRDGLGLGGPLIGSNNWVIGGIRSATGKPILANDPHLGAQVPSIWYLAHVTGGGIDAIGATLPGLPGVVIGHNQRIAWGVTNTGPDVQDLFIERISGNTVEYKGAQEPLTVITETIKVKGQPDVPLQVRITRHGPVISDVIEDNDQTLAFRWTALDDEDHTLGAFLALNRAGSWQEFTAALKRYHAPMQNFVYADVDGNIGYYAPGALPIRAKGDGLVPVPGWTGEYDWSGYAPFEQLPHSYNPEQGFIVSANNRVAPDNYPYLIGSNFAAPYRAIRITELIKAKALHTLDDVAAMQADVRSAQAAALLPYLLQAEPADERSARALELLRGWDGTMSRPSAAAAVYQAWYKQLPLRLFADEVGEDLADSYPGDPVAIVMPGLLRDNAAWCDDTRTAERESCAATMGLALRDGLADMAQAQGSDDPSAWRWDKVHIALFPHNPFDSVPQLQPIFSRSIPNDGDRFTVNVAPPDENYRQSHVPSYRGIMDLADLDRSRFMHTVGQSGNPLSPHYSDLLERWQRVEYLPMTFSRGAVDAAASERLVLEP
ncbi:MAG TPA: penicillin acylase family protein [Roseiflexaceae bacterium]|nr:penicillin acylase family protein [Roseiflexaceae bacterium]